MRGTENFKLLWPCAPIGQHMHSSSILGDSLVVAKLVGSLGNGDCEGKALLFWGFRWSHQFQG